MIPDKLVVQEKGRHRRDPWAAVVRTQLEGAACETVTRSIGL